MANSQWKNYQAPGSHDPAILAFQRSAATTGSYVNNGGTTTAVIDNTSSCSNNANNSNVTNGMNEIGFIEKLLHSYGFIQCCDRDRESRLFFHFSEYQGNLDSVKIGEMVEFQRSVDRRTGKPIAVSVVRADHEIMSEAQVAGTVVSQTTPNKGQSPDALGQVSYEESGEFFFLPYSQEDVDGGARLSVGDQVTFFVSRDKRNGNLQARKVKLQQAVESERFEGVVCSMKESFGFIERADVVKEIFFHYSEYQGDIAELLLGDDVEFKIQTRNGKEVAQNITRLPEGTVIFEDVAMERRRGKIAKTLRAPHGRRSSDPLAGRIVYETLKGPIEIPFGDKDQKGDYALQIGDLVDFNIATDRRDKLQRATNIELVEDTFKINGESRETGMMVKVKEGFGFIRCAEREARMFFHFSEMLCTDHEPRLNDEVSFTIIQDPTDKNRQIAIRIKNLPKGSVSFDSVLPEKYVGTVEKEPVSFKSPGKNKDPDPGIIMYDVNGTKQTIPYGVKVIQGFAPKCGDKVEFQICESRSNNTKTAANVNMVGRGQPVCQQGFVATLKDQYGFLESAEHDREVFFHFSNFDGEPSELDLGDEVEYTLAKKTNKVSAENIRKIPKGSVAPEDILPGVLNGRIIQCMRIINPDQEEYPGVVQISSEDGDGQGESYTYGITSLGDKRDFLQKGDSVTFQIAIVKSSGKRRATNIAAVRKSLRAKVESVKGQFGFLTYEPEEGKKIFFHMTEVDGGTELHQGDEVEFVVVHNQRTGKYSACNVRRISQRQRPERLFSRLKSVGEESGPKIIVIRQPLGPSGSKGFTYKRSPWKQAQ